MTWKYEDWLQQQQDTVAAIESKPFKYEDWKVGIAQPSSTSVSPIQSKSILGEEPEEPSSVGAVFRNTLRDVKGLINLPKQGEEIANMIERVNKAGEFSIGGGFKQIAKELGRITAPLGDVAKLHIYSKLPQELQDDPEIQERQSESLRNLGLNPLAVPTSVAMLLGGGAYAKGAITPKLQYLKSGTLAEMPKVTGEITPKAKTPIKKVSATPKPKPTEGIETLLVDKTPLEVPLKPNEYMDIHGVIRKKTAMPPATGKLPSDKWFKEWFKGEEPKPEVAKPAPAGKETWYRGQTDKATGDVFYSKSESVAGDFGTQKLGEKPQIKTLTKKPDKLYRASSKDALAEELGITEDINTKAFDNAVKSKLQSQGYRGVEYAEGTLGEGELHIFSQKPTPAGAKVPGEEALQLKRELGSESGKIYVPVEEVRGAVDKAVKSLDIKKSPEAIAVKELNELRRGNIAEADTRVGYAKQRIDQAVPDPARRKLITHARENPKLRGELSEIEKGVLNEVGRFYDEGFKVAKDADVINSAVENYITHVWKKDSPKTKLFASKYISPKTRFAQQRSVPTIAEGKKMGLNPLTEDPGELMQIWSRSVHRAIANKRFLDELKIMEAEDGRLLVQPSNSAPSDYVWYDHPSLRQYKWRGKEGKGAIFQTGVKVHPDIAGPINVAFEQGWQPRGKMAQRVFNAYTALDRGAKKSILTVSLFHYHALSESAIATGQSPWAFVRGVAKKVNGEELIVRAKRSGLQIGGTPDVARQSLRFEKVPVLKQTVGKIIEKNDEFLWDNVHAGHKIEAFDRITRDALTNKKYSHLKPEQIDRVASEFINDAFGGLDWEGLGVSTKNQWLLQRGFLAPDWTLSQIRVAKGIFRIGGKGTPRRLSGQLYRGYWRRAIMYNLGGANALNYVFTAWKAGDPKKGHFMIQNASGHRFQLELPFNGSDGKPRWIQVGKQFMEPFRYAEDIIGGKPFRTLSAKMGPTNRIILGSIFNRKYPGGPQIYSEKDKMHMKYLKSLGYTAESVFPIPAQQYLQTIKGRKDLADAFISSLGFPVKKDYPKSSRSGGRSGGR